MSLSEQCIVTVMPSYMWALFCLASVVQQLVQLLDSCVWFCCLPACDPSQLKCCSLLLHLVCFHGTALVLPWLYTACIYVLLYASADCMHASIHATAPRHLHLWCFIYLQFSRYLINIYWVWWRLLNYSNHLLINVSSLIVQFLIDFSVQIF